MSQASPTIGAEKSGLTYRQEDNDGKKALLTHHKGATAPGYAEAGMIWLDDSTTPWGLKLHDGADWVVLGTVHAGDNAFLPYHGTGALKYASFAVDSGSANAAVVTPVPAVASYAAGLAVILKPAASTTGASTLAVSGMDAQDIKLANGADTAAGSMVAGGIYMLVHDGTNFILCNPEKDTSPPSGAVIARATDSYSLNENLETIIPLDDTIPQASEGTEVLTASLTPQHAANKIRVTVKGFGTTSESSVALVAALMIDGSPAVAATAVSGAAGALLPLDLQYEYTAGDTSAHDFSIRIGPGTAGAVRLNGQMAGRYFGGVSAVRLTVEEIKG